MRIHRREKRNESSCDDDQEIDHGPLPPGWYPDPTLPSAMRFWSGSTWTEQMLPPPPSSWPGPPSGVAQSAAVTSIDAPADSSVPPPDGSENHSITPAGGEAAAERATAPAVGPSSSFARLLQDENSGWRPDPFRRHEGRYFNRGQPTNRVRDGLRFALEDISSEESPPRHLGPPAMSGVTPNSTPDGDIGVDPTAFPPPLASTRILPSPNAPLPVPSPMESTRTPNLPTENDGSRTAAPIITTRRDDDGPGTNDDPDTALPGPELVHETDHADQRPVEAEKAMAKALAIGTPAAWREVAQASFAVSEMTQAMRAARDMVHAAEQATAVALEAARVAADLTEGVAEARATNTPAAWHEALQLAVALGALEAGDGWSK